MLSVAAVVDVAAAFEREAVRYLFVGGLAVIAHGYVRLTTDLDIVIDLQPDNIRRAVTILAGLGFKPQAPVAIEAFVDARQRQEWVATKDMVVFPVWRDSATGPVVIDIFLLEPFSFPPAYLAAFWQTHASGTRFPFVDLNRLLAMKASAGRPKDVIDIEELRKVHGI